jgi:hypothetical protein
MTTKDFDYEKRFDSLIEKSRALKIYRPSLGYGETEPNKVIEIRQDYSNLLQGLIAELDDTKWMVLTNDGIEITKEETNEFLNELKGV